MNNVEQPPQHDPREQEHVGLRLAGAITELRDAIGGLAGGRSWAEDLDLHTAWPNPVASQRFRPFPDLAVAVWNRYAVDVDVTHTGSGKPVCHVPAGRAVVQNMPVEDLLVTAAADPGPGQPLLRIVRYEREQGIGIWDVATGEYVQPLAGTVWDIADRATRLTGRVSIGVGDSLQAAGKVTAPGAGAAICTLAAPPAGVYAVEIDLVVSANTDTNNMKLQKQGVDLFNPILVGNLNVSQHNYRISLSGAQNLSINAVIAGTAGVTYQAQIIATRVE